MKNITYNYCKKLHTKIDKIINNYLDVDCYEQTTCNEEYEYYLKEPTNKNQIKKLKNDIIKLIEEDDLDIYSYDNTIQISGSKETPYIELHIYCIDDFTTLCTDILFVE